jgi:hypothetical protein
MKINLWRSKQGYFWYYAEMPTVYQESREKETADVTGGKSIAAMSSSRV